MPARNLRGGGWRWPIFLYNPIHGLEPVWWMAVWIVFTCRVKDPRTNLDKRRHRAAYDSLFAIGSAGRENAFRSERFLDFGAALHPKMSPLFEILYDLRYPFHNMYSDYEMAFEHEPRTAQDLARYIVKALELLRDLSKDIQIESLYFRATM